MVTHSDLYITDLAISGIRENVIVVRMFLLVHARLSEVIDCLCPLVWSHYVHFSTCLLHSNAVARWRVGLCVYVCMCASMHECISTCVHHFHLNYNNPVTDILLPWHSMQRRRRVYTLSSTVHVMSNGRCIPHKFTSLEFHLCFLRWSQHLPVY